MKISIIGTGYVGLVSGTCFSETGHNVLCLDINESKIQQLKAGKIPIYEPGLESLFERNVKENRLNFTNDLKEAVDHADVIFLALPTPPGEDGSADLSYILDVANNIGPLLKEGEYKVIVDKSTVPIGTAEKVRKVIAQKTSADFDVVSNPEFLREGVAVDDFLKPDRVVIGASSEKAVDVMKKLYEPFLRQGNPIYFMDILSAEMTKYAANSYLATRISFMNEIANLCERVGANVDNVRIGMGSDSRIGKRFLFSGIGYGGSCFPKDVQALYKIAKNNDYHFKILDSVMETNKLQKEVLLEKVKDFYGENLKGKKIAIWGLAFKPNTDDIREAPSISIIDGLQACGAEVVAYDPEALENMKKLYEGNDQITFFEDRYQMLKNADCLLLLTEWNVFRSPDFQFIKDLLKEPVIFDGRNVFNKDELIELGFYYNSIGKEIVDGRSNKRQNVA